MRSQINESIIPSANNTYLSVLIEHPIRENIALASVPIIYKLAKIALGLTSNKIGIDINRHYNDNLITHKFLYGTIDILAALTFYDLYGANIKNNIRAIYNELTAEYKLSKSDTADYTVINEERMLSSTYCHIEKPAAVYIHNNYVDEIIEDFNYASLDSISYIDKAQSAHTPLHNIFKSLILGTQKAVISYYAPSLSLYQISFDGITIDDVNKFSFDIDCSVRDFIIIPIASFLLSKLAIDKTNLFDNIQNTAYYLINNDILNENTGYTDIKSLVEEVFPTVEENLYFNETIVKY